MPAAGEKDWVLPASDSTALAGNNKITAGIITISQL
jgi:hypothetical protein